MSHIFRKSALDRLESPEQLDLLLEVTRPKGWLALVGLGLLVAVGIVWAFVGSLPTRVAGTGILVRKGGLSAINAVATGQLIELHVQAGTEVKRGQSIARLALPDLVASLESTEADLAVLEAEDQKLAQFGSTDSRLQSQAIAQQRRAAIGDLNAAQDRAKSLTEKLRVQRALLNEGLVTEQTIQATSDSVAQARGDIERAQGALKELTVRENDLRQRIQKETGDRQIRLAELQRRVTQLKEKIRTDSRIVSPAAGRVIEVRSAVGSVITAGTPVVLLEHAEARDQAIEAIVYVSGADGKRIQPGMLAEVSPSTVKREEFGSLRATVTAVSAFPSTQQAMVARLGNPDLVAAFLKAIDTPIELRVDLQRDAQTKSGYGWTSRAGPPSSIQPGTLCVVRITVRERPPIALVIPFLREKLGL